MTLFPLKQDFVRSAQTLGQWTQNSSFFAEQEIHHNVW